MIEKWKFVSYVGQCWLKMIQKIELKVTFTENSILVLFGFVKLLRNSRSDGKKKVWIQKREEVDQIIEEVEIEIEIETEIVTETETEIGIVPAETETETETEIVTAETAETVEIVEIAETEIAEIEIEVVVIMIDAIGIEALIGNGDVLETAMKSANLAEDGMINILSFFLLSFVDFSRGRGLENALRFGSFLDSLAKYTNFIFREKKISFSTFVVGMALAAWRFFSFAHSKKSKKKLCNKNYFLKI
mmetsp:Transcript_28765/g.39815  ORF Transcript_28765/g.39815 Transcript_28765/m.39815 type:complete len:247 (-) Transcript_28765:7-747(-)